MPHLECQESPVGVLPWSRQKRQKRRQLSRECPPCGRSAGVHRGYRGRGSCVEAGQRVQVAAVGQWSSGGGCGAGRQHLVVWGGGRTG